MTSVEAEDSPGGAVRQLAVSRVRDQGDTSSISLPTSSSSLSYSLTNRHLDNHQYQQQPEPLVVTLLADSSEGPSSVSVPVDSSTRLVYKQFSIAMSPLQLAAIVLLVLPFALSTIFLIIGSVPFFQKQFLYAHKINSLFWDDLEAPETWGFAHNQVTPFNITTSDGETLYAWHILPLSLYSASESLISQETRELRLDITKTEGFRILKQDADRKVVLYFHGNAGHLANGWRPQTYHALTDNSDYHVIAFDYRGFGKSTGSPSEEGLIIDARAVIDWVMTVAKVPPENIALFGHSLGTAVVSAALEHYSDSRTTFAGTLLVAPFSALPTLLSGYRLLGTFPVLGPLPLIPRVERWIQGLVRERWPSVERLVRAVKICPPGLRITLLHALDDYDIPSTETDIIFYALASTLSSDPLNQESFDDKLRDLTTETDHGGTVTTWIGEPNVVIRRVMFPYGGHNLVMTYAPMILSIHRFFHKDHVYE